jgi:hypothetical protein
LIANFYLGMYAQTKLGAKRNHAVIKAIEQESEITALEKEQRTQEVTEWREPAA